MKVFGNYARYYNLLYRDKDYAEEAQFVHQLLQRYAPHTKSILDLGCGTGSHAVQLALEGYSVHGVDLSADMLHQASDRLSHLTSSEASRLEFSQGDIRTIRLDKQFDAVIALFHVISYQTTNEDLRAAFATVKAHLQPGGVFIFDCWYGPGVLSDRPTVRVKRLEDSAISVTRIAEPVIHPNENIVDVNYQVLIKDKDTNVVEQVKEKHQMRYLFKPEVELLLSENQLDIVDCREWLTGKVPGWDTWGVYFAAMVKV